MDRRCFIALSGAAVAAAVVPSRQTRALSVSSLTAKIDPVELADLSGTRVEVAGFAVPHSGKRAPFFVLVGSLNTACPHCRAFASAQPDSMLVFPRNGRLTNDRIWQGVLDVGGQVDAETGYFSQMRLLDAEPIGRSIP